MTRSRCKEPATASVQVGVRVTETFFPGNLAAPRRLTALLTRFQPFKPEVAVFWAEAVATYEALGRPSVKRGCEAACRPSRKWPVSVCWWPRGLAVGAVSVDGSPVALACGGESLRAGVASPVARRSIEVSWTIDAELLSFLAEKCPAPDGYGAAPTAVSVEVRVNLFGSEQALRRILEVAVAVTPAAAEDVEL